MKKIYTAVIFVFLFSFASSAEDLLSVYKSAVENDPQFRAAQAAYRAELELKNQSISAFLPTISASVYYTEHDNETVTNVTTLFKFNSNGYNLSLTQSLYSHENYVRLNQADAQVAQAAAAIKNAKQDLIIRVTTQYFAVLAAKDDLELAIAERRSIREQLLQTEQRFDAGMIAITGTHEAKARFDLAVARAIVAENTLAISHETLREITAKKHDSLAALSAKHPLIKPDPADIQQWVTTANNQNALLLTSKKSVEVAQAEVARQSARHFPTLDLKANYSSSDIGGGFIGGGREQTNNSVSIQLNIPLYQGGIVNSQTRAAAFRLTEAREKFEQQKRATERQTRSAYLSVIANISQVNALKQALASSLIALEATTAGLEVGTRTAVDVLDSQRDLFRARRDYAQVRYDYVLETLNLKFAAGILSSQDIEQLNPWLE